MGVVAEELDPACMAEREASDGILRRVDNLMVVSSEAAVCLVSTTMVVLSPAPSALASSPRLGPLALDRGVDSRLVVLPMLFTRSCFVVRLDGLLS